MTQFDTQDAVLAWLRSKGVGIEYDASWGKYTFPSGDLYALLKALQPLTWKRLGEATPTCRGMYLCRLVGQHVPGGVDYRGLLWDDGFYGGGAATISHWTEIEEVKA